MEKRVQDYSKEILKIIRSNTSPAVMGGRLQDYHENDLADVLYRSGASCTVSWIQICSLIFLNIQMRRMQQSI